MKVDVMLNELKKRPKWFEYIRVRERRILGTNRPPDYVPSFGPAIILKPELNPERAEMHLRYAKDWLWMWIERDQFELRRQADFVPEFMQVCQDTLEDIQEAIRTNGRPSCEKIEAWLVDVLKKVEVKF